MPTNVPAPRCQYCDKLVNTKLTDGSFFAYKTIDEELKATITVFTHVDCFFKRFNYIDKLVRQLSATQVKK
jgi:hypothetical protein